MYITRKNKLDMQNILYGRNFIMLNKIEISSGRINKCTSHYTCMNALLNFFTISYARFKNPRDSLRLERILDLST